MDCEHAHCCDADEEGYSICLRCGGLQPARVPGRVLEDGLPLPAGGITAADLVRYAEERYVDDFLYGDRSGGTNPWVGPQDPSEAMYVARMILDGYTVEPPRDGEIEMSHPNGSYGTIISVSQERAEEIYREALEWLRTP